MADQPGFYIGKKVDPEKGKLLDEKVIYDPVDLTTHGFVTGMTGSGKTGLCIELLEEAALEGIPAIMIDPKGDLTNLLLHFPEFRPEDFKPWIDPDVVRRENKDLDTAAAETAAMWKDGLAQWGLGPDDIRQLQKSVDFTIYTPGSSASQPVSILASFQAPGISWEENSEILREEISSTVTAVLGLVGMTDIDPLRSREHILLSNIIENAWSHGQSLDLNELILQTQNPPFERLGAFPVDNLFPAKDRMELAMLLNNFLASPSFQTWIEGVPLDIPSFLFTADGKPRHSIFYLAHLPDNERMFFVTLLFASIEAWMRQQRGTGSLRALIYFDEIVGYLPPIANPPSRPIMLRMLKQARAFGVGLLLATQNPVDLDYKALSNAGTWFIGRLQTERDKMRLLDGLESARGDINRTAIDKILSGMGKRVFLLHNVNEKAPQLFQTRWAMNYLAGPLTRAQLPLLNQLVGKGKTPAAASTGVAAPQVGAPVVNGNKAIAAPAGAAGYQKTRPVVPQGMTEFFIPADLGISQAVSEASLPVAGSIEAEGLVYKPTLLAQAEVRYIVQKYGMEYSQKVASLVSGGTRNLLDWEKYVWRVYERSELQSSPLPNSLFAVLPGWLSDAKAATAFRSDFEDWVFRTGTIRVKVNQVLKVYAGPQVSGDEFRDLCSKAASELADAEQDKLAAIYQKKLDAMEAKIKRQELEVEEQKSDLNARRLEEAGTHGELLLSMFVGRKRSVSKSITKRRMTSQSKLELKQEEEELAVLEQQMDALEAEYKKALGEIQEKWEKEVTRIEEVPVSPSKTNIFLDNYGVAWVPYYLVKSEGQVKEVLAAKR
jgi:hypothetical protein